VEPILGRTFTETEATSGNDHVVILLNDLWRKQFGADAHITGKTVRLSGAPYVVIGVMPISFHMPSLNSTGAFGASTRPAALGVILPLSFSPERLAETMGDLNYFGLGRLKAGATLQGATADLDVLQHAIALALPANEMSTLSVDLTSFQEFLVGNNRTPLYVLLGAVSALLLVGCINVANLLLARAVVHADARVGDGEDLLLFIKFEVDAWRIDAIADERFVFVVDKGRVAELVECVGGVGDQFAEEDLRVGVKRMDDQLEELIYFSLKLLFGHSTLDYYKVDRRDPWDELALVEFGRC
jgi:hypothetical protein